MAFHLAEFIDRLADHVHDPSQGLPPDRDADRLTGIDGLHAAHHSVGGLHADAAHAVFSQVLLDLGADADRLAARFPLDNDAVVDRRKMLLLELAVNHRTDNLYYLPNLFH